VTNTYYTFTYSSCASLKTPFKITTRIGFAELQPHGLQPTEGSSPKVNPRELVFFLNQPFPSTHLARKAVDQAVSIYNSKRLHVSLGFKTPDHVFMCVA